MSRTIKANQPLPLQRSAAAVRINHELQRRTQIQRACDHSRLTTVETGLGQATACIDCGTTELFGRVFAGGANGPGAA